MSNFWDSDAWGYIMLFAVLFGGLLVGNVLKKAIPFLRESLIPTSVLGGLITTVILLLGGVSGGFVLAWRLIIALLYVPVTVFRFLFLCEGSIMNRIQTTYIINNV